MSIITRNSSLLRRPAIAPLLTKASLTIPLYRHFPRLQTYPAANLGQYRWSSTTFPKTPSFPINSKGFPNFFYPENEDAKQKTLAQINLAMEAILRRLEVPYIDPDSGQVKTDGFFAQAEAIVHKQDPSAKVYISGGVVRSILGWIYAELYKEYEKNPSVMNPEKVLSEIICSSEPLCKSDVLGAGSDLDLLIDFSPNLSFATKTQIQNDLTYFINKIGENIPDSVLKRSLLPIADINEYETQTANSSQQGGSPLDWLAFPLTPKSGSAIKAPANHPDIMDNFIKGEIRYVPIRKTGRNGLLSNKDQKGIIRQLRPLMEIPFLKPSKEVQDLLLADFETLQKTLQSGNTLCDKAMEQLEKTVRNCRFPAVCNQIAIPREHATDLDKKIQKISSQIRKSKSVLNPSVSKLPIVPELLPSKNIESRPEDFDPGNLRKQGLLTSYNDFILKYTDDGRLYHGTPSIDTIVPMIRCGLAVSTDQLDRLQGIAAYGRGFYTTSDLETAHVYAGLSGIILPLQIFSSQKLRIIDLNTIDTNILNNLRTAACSEGMDFHEYLERKMAIDFIITDKESKIILIQNQNALSLPKTPKDLFTKAILSFVEHKISQAIQSQKMHHLKDLEKYTIIINFLNKNDWVFKNKQLSKQLKELILSELKNPKTKTTTLIALNHIPSYLLGPPELAEKKNTALDLVKSHGFFPYFSFEDRAHWISQRQFQKLLEDPETGITAGNWYITTTSNNTRLNEAILTEVQRRNRALILACFGILLSGYAALDYYLFQEDYFEKKIPPFTSGHFNSLLQRLLPQLPLPYLNRMLLTRYENKLKTAIASNNLPAAASLIKSIIEYRPMLNSNELQELFKDIAEVLNLAIKLDNPRLFSDLIESINKSLYFYSELEEFYESAFKTAIELNNLSLSVALLNYINKKFGSGDLHYSDNIEKVINQAIQVENSEILSDLIQQFEKTYLYRSTVAKLYNKWTHAAIKLHKPEILSPLIASFEKLSDRYERREIYESCVKEAINLDNPRAFSDLIKSFEKTPDYLDSPTRFYSDWIYAAIEMDKPEILSHLIESFEKSPLQPNDRLHTYEIALIMAIELENLSVAASLLKSLQTSLLDSNEPDFQYSKVINLAIKLDNDLILAELLEYFEKPSREFWERSYTRNRYADWIMKAIDLDNYQALSVLIRSFEKPFLDYQDRKDVYAWMDYQDQMGVYARSLKAARKLNKPAADSLLSNSVIRSPLDLFDRWELYRNSPEAAAKFSQPTLFSGLTKPMEKPSSNHKKVYASSLETEAEFDKLYSILRTQRPF